MARWREVLTALDHVVPSRKRPVLDDVESALGLPLPQSYRDYIWLFGYGILADMYCVWSPEMLQVLSPAHAAEVAETLSLGLWPSDVAHSLKGVRLIPFGKSDNGDLLAWEVPSDRRPSEPPIRILHHEQTSAPVVCHGLLEFVRDVVVAGEIDVLFPRGAAEKWELERSFVPLKERIVLPAKAKSLRRAHERFRRSSKRPRRASSSD